MNGRTAASGTDVEEAPYMYGLRGRPSAALPSLLVCIMPSRLAMPPSGRRTESGEVEYVGTKGRLRLAAVLCAGSAGPGRGVESDSSDDSPDAGSECDSEAVELDTGEQGRGAIGVVASWAQDTAGIGLRKASLGVWGDVSLEKRKENVPDHH
jgi:hypothetical protein